MLAYALVLFVAALALNVKSSPKRQYLPIFNQPRWFEPEFIRKLIFLLFPMDIIEKARRANRGKPFKIFHYAGEVTVLPSEYADLVAFDKRLSLGAYLKKVCSPLSLIAIEPEMTGCRTSIRTSLA